MKTLEFNNSKGLALLSQEMIYTSSLKKLEKHEKCYFQNIRSLPEDIFKGIFYNAHFRFM